MVVRKVVSITWWGYWSQGIAIPELIKYIRTYVRTYAHNDDDDDGLDPKGSSTHSQNQSTSSYVCTYVRLYVRTYVMSCRYFCIWLFLNLSGVSLDSVFFVRAVLARTFPSGPDADDIDDANFFPWHENFGKNGSVRRDRFQPKIVEIRATLAILELLQIFLFGNVSSNASDVLLRTQGVSFFEHEECPSLNTRDVSLRK